jgi:hypothetical protein
MKVRHCNLVEIQECVMDAKLLGSPERAKLEEEAWQLLAQEEVELEAKYAAEEAAYKAKRDQELAAHGIFPFMEEYSLFF